MICPLIAAAELNDEFRATMEFLLEKTWSKDVDAMHRTHLADKISSFSYRLGKICVTDLDNLEIFNGIQLVFHKTRMMLDGGRI